MSFTCHQRRRPVTLDLDTLHHAAKRRHAANTIVMSVAALACTALDAFKAPHIDLSSERLKFYHLEVARHDTVHKDSWLMHLKRVRTARKPGDNVRESFNIGVVKHLMQLPWKLNTFLL